MREAGRALLAAFLLWCAAFAQAVTYSNAPTAFNWIDPSTHTAVTWSSPTQCTGGGDTIGDDSITAPINIGFTFNFGGVNYTQLRIMSNGRVQFNNTYCGAGTQTVGPPRTYTLPYPNANLVNSMKVYGADIDTSPNGSGGGPGPTTCPPATCSVRYTATPLGTAPNRQFVVTWVNTPDWGSTGSFFNLQVILNEDGSFVFQYGASNNPDGGHADIGWEVNTTDYATITYATIGSLANTAIRFFIPSAVAEYRMDEASWSGANSVLDSSGNNNHGSPVGAAQTVAGGKVCRGGNIPLNTTAGTVDAVNSNIDVNTLGSSGTITFWYKANAAWNTNDNQLFDATTVNNQFFFLVKRASGRLRFVVDDSAATTVVVETGNKSFAAGTWKHIGITWRLAAGAGQTVLRVYIDGVLDTTATVTTNGALHPSLGTLYFGDNRGVANGSNSTFRSADGVIDEVRVYNFEGGTGLIQRDFNATHPCGPQINNFLIDIGAASASTCAPKNITITARDAANATLTTYTGTVNISTSAGHGDWAIVTANGVLNNGAADDGAASYAFAAADNGVITLGLSNTHADDTTVSVVDSGVPSTLSTSGVINFRDNVFVITEDPIQVAGRNQAMSVALWRKDPSTGNCAINTAYTGAKNLDAWLARDPVDPGGAAPTIGALSLPNSAPPSNPASNNLALTFTNGQANFNLSTTDVGKYVLNMRDDTRTFATGVDISGASNTLTTRPFALGFTNIKQGALVNPGGTSGGGAKFVAAEDTFQATVGGYLWSAADDVNNDGVPDSSSTNVTDNGLTPSFAWATTLSATTPITPVGGSTGALGGSVNIAMGSYSGGTATVSNLTYNQVGSMTLRADAAGYLGSAVNLSGTSVTVGRFYPDHFALVASGLSAACNGFTYMDQAGVNLSFTLQAQGKNNGLASNYSAALGYPVTAIAVVAENADAGTDLGPRITWATTTWSGGQYGASSPTSTFSRNATPDGPYDALAVGIRAVDADGAVIANRDMNAATTGDCVTAGNCDAKQIGGATTMARFGRLRLGNANGSQLLPLPIPIEVQHWSGTAFITNTADSCTTLAGTNIEMSNFQGALGPIGACKTRVSDPVTFASGRGNLQLAKPAGGATGSVDLVAHFEQTVSGSPQTCTGASPVAVTGANRRYLQGNWTGGAYDQNPTGRAAFGVYKGSGEVIFLRENF